jgi:hypothetical protein
VANVLAREASTDDIGSNSICSEAVGGKGFDIIVAGDGRPMLFEDRSAEGLDLAERDGSHPGSFEPEREAANS